MRSLEIIDDIVYEKKDDTFSLLTATQIYDLGAEMGERGIRLSKLSLDAKIQFEFQNDEIFVMLSVKKNGVEFFIKKNGSHFLDYAIISGVWYYLSFDNAFFNSIIEKEKIDISKSITFGEYLSLKKSLGKNNIDYIDNVETEINHVKSFSPNDIINHEINGTLFDYQNIGFNWLSFMYRNNCGAILADEMGLGKTLQIIALMAYLKWMKEGAHFLIICPLSLLENWRREINKFSPNLSVLVHHGQFRTGSYNELKKYDVTITSYSNSQSDLSMLNMICWDLLVIDEAQNIKNPYANRTKNIKQIQTKVPIAVTGTPFENHVEDIWSIVDFIMPNYLGTLGAFKNEFQDDIESAERIEPLISPLMIRRRVKDVAKDLPERIDIPQPIIMDETEAMLYENNRKNVLQSLSELKIDKIQKLRMFCTHPFVYDKERQGDPFLVSAKYQRLCEILDEIFANREKVIIFTSFNKMNELLVGDISRRFMVPSFSITGETEVSSRQKIIDEFSNKDGASALVLNPKVAGAGLNITAANHVVHYNLEWNPAIEDQASARAYRRGQEKTVFVYRLFYSGTIEEIINDRLSRKRDISETAIIGNQGELDAEDLEKALSISPIRRGE